MEIKEKYKKEMQIFTMKDKNCEKFLHSISMLTNDIKKDALVRFAYTYAILYGNRTNEYHSILTSLLLIKKIMDKFPNNYIGQTFLIYYTVEWAIYLHDILKIPAENITVYCDSTERVDICKNIGFCVIDKHTEFETTVKFDIIVGNPPYKNGPESGGKETLWRFFIKKSWGLLKDDGYLSFVVPTLPNSAKDIGYIFTDNQVTHVWRDIKKYFDVGSTFSAWIVKKTPKITKTDFVNEGLYNITKDRIPKDFECIPILNKFKSDTNFVWTHSNFLKTQNLKDEKIFSPRPNVDYPYKIRRTTAKPTRDDTYAYCIYCPDNYMKPKVTLTLSGNPHFIYDEQVGTLKDMSAYMLVENKTESENLIGIYNSNLYRFYFKCYVDFNTGFRSARNYTLPKLDITRSWSNSDIYAHFNLTAEEIAFVEQYK